RDARAQEEESSITILSVAVALLGERLPKQNGVLRLPTVEEAQAHHVAVGGVIVRSGDASPEDCRDDESDAYYREPASQARLTLTFSYAPTFSSRSHRACPPAGPAHSRSSHRLSCRAGR